MAAMLMGGMTWSNAQQPGGDPDFTTIITTMGLINPTINPAIIITAELRDVNGDLIGTETRTTNPFGHWGEWHFDYLTSLGPFSITLIHDSTIVHTTCFAFSSDTYPDGLFGFATFNNDVISNVISNPGEDTLCQVVFDDVISLVPSTITENLDEIVTSLEGKDQKIANLLAQQQTHDGDVAALENIKIQIDGETIKLKDLNLQVDELIASLQLILTVLTS